MKLSAVYSLVACELRALLSQPTQALASYHLMTVAQIYNRLLSL